MSDFDIIAAAVVEGRVKRIPAGVSGRPVKAEPLVRFHPALCGKGDRIPRAPYLDELDGDFA